MRKIIIILFITLLTPSTIYANNIIEKWECKETYGLWINILVKATVFKGRTKGEIHVAGITHDSYFEIHGFNRRWDFGEANNKGILKYMFKIKPNGEAHYFEFGSEKTAKSSIILKCRQLK